MANIRMLAHHNRSISNWDMCDNTTNVRLIIVIFVFFVFFIALGFRVTKLSLSGYKKSAIVYNQSLTRKEIVDRNGNILAVNIPSASLFANPIKVIDAQNALEKLAAIIPDLDTKKLSGQLSSSNKSFVWIKRDITPQQQIAIASLGLPGFDFEHEQKRFYPFGNKLAHVLGYVGRDMTGLAGFEKSYDKILLSRQKSDIASKIPEDTTVELSIDVRLQAILHEELAATIQKFKASRGVAIVADPNNGEIIGMVCNPDFDPSNPQVAKPEQLFNIASHGVYEMGSVFKTLTIAIGLDTKSITTHDAYDISYMKVGKFEIKDYHPKRGFHSIGEILLHSSNIGASQIMLGIGESNFKYYLKHLGLFDQLQIELPERSTPLFPVSNHWSDLSLATMSYGYGISISPLHFVQAILPVVNGGYLRSLTLVKQKDPLPANAQVFTNETSKQMRHLLRFVVSNGASRDADIKGYFVGGKTGTAHKSIKGGYGKNSRISSFVAVLPAHDPKYVIYVMLDDPKGIQETGGLAIARVTAVPMVSKIIKRMIALYGLEASDENDQEVQNMLNIDYRITNEV